MSKIWLCSWISGRTNDFLDVLVEAETSDDAINKLRALWFECSYGADELYFADFVAVSELTGVNDGEAKDIP